MTEDGEYVAVLDRFEESPDGRLAALVLERDGEAVEELAVVPGELPQEARHRDAVLSVVVEDGALVDATYRESETAERREDAQSRFDRLARRPGEEESDEGTADDASDG